MPQHLRIARPVTDLAQSVRMYCDGLGWKVLAEFADQDGFDGAMRRITSNSRSSGTVARHRHDS